MANVHFEIVTPEKLVRSDEAFMIVVPGTEGDFGVLAGHAPMMSVIRDGEIAIYSSPTAITSRIMVKGGFAEVNDKGLTILAEHVEEIA